MKKNGLKIKEEITLTDKINAINAIVDSCFLDGEYTPYFLEKSLVEYIAIFCMEGFELDANDDLYDIVLSDPEFKELISKFFGVNDDNKYTEVQEFILKNVTSIVDYKRQRMIYGTDTRDAFMKDMMDVAEAIVDISKNISYAAKPVIENPEYGKHMLSIMKKLDKNKVISKDTLVDMVMDIAKKTGAFTKPKDMEEKSNLHIVKDETKEEKETENK